MKTDIENITYCVLLEEFFCRLYQISEIANYCLPKGSAVIKKFLFSDNSAVDPPEPIPNSEVKCSSADGSVGVPM